MEETIERDRSTTLFELLRTRRGWTDEYLAEIEDPHYTDLQGMDEMVATLHSLKRAGKKIVVVPDFDMDGISSGVLGYAGLCEMGFDAGLYVPDHRRGHDVTAEAIDEMLGQFPDAAAIITCDCGINSNAAMEHAKSKGLLTLVTDHHVELPPGSSADVAVDPARIQEDYPHPGICGAFVLYQVLMAYASAHARHKVGDVSMLKLFAGLGTVSDVMPLRYENRQVVKDSLSLARLLHSAPGISYDPESSILMQLLRAQDHAPQYLDAFEGFAHVLATFHDTGKLRSVTDLNEGFYGFYLAPAFNSIRRINGSMYDAFGAFFHTTASDKRAAADRVLAGNELRKEMVIGYLEELESRDQPLAPQVYLTSAPAGMLGLLASRLCSETGGPVAVLNERSLSGSARSPFWFPIIEEMTGAGFRAVGHENACGVSVSGPGDLEPFAEALAEAAERVHAQAVLDGSLKEAAATDLVIGDHSGADADLAALDELLEFVQHVDALAPYGHGFAKPTVSIALKLSECNVSSLGKDAKHVKITARSGLALLWWNAADKLMALREIASDPISSAVEFKASLSINEFRGNLSVQAFVDDVLTVPSTYEGAL